MEKKFYELVAWTVPGGVKSVPSLTQELEQPYLDEIRELEAPGTAEGHSHYESPEEEKSRILALSHAYERLADFRLKSGRINAAYSALEEAAFAAIPCSDSLWLDSDFGFFPTLPLMNRFLAMHARVRSLAREHKLESRYKGSRLEKEYYSLTAFDRELYKEFREGYETIKVWKFGKNR